MRKDDIMIKSITIKQKSELSDVLMFDKKIELKQVTLLFGGNGVGKSSLINGILKRKVSLELDDTKTMLYSYINSKQNFRNLEKNDNLSMKDFFEPKFFADKFDAQDLSEGQSIIYSLQDIFKLCDQIKDDEEDSLFLLDEIDSGLSIDNVEYLGKKIKKICKENPKFQFIIAFNSYEFCRLFKEVFNMYTGEWIKIKDYDEYRNILKLYRKALLKKRKNNMFTGNSDF